MNSYELNSIAGHHYRKLICETLNVNISNIYKTVKYIDNEGIISLQDGKKYKPILILKRIEIDYFYEASRLFLTEPLTYDQFDETLQKGEILPICEDFEGWDPDYLESKIKELAETMKKIR